MARASDLMIARAAYREAVVRHPGKLVMLCQKARILAAAIDHDQEAKAATRMADHTDPQDGAVPRPSRGPTLTPRSRSRSRNTGLRTSNSSGAWWRSRSSGLGEIGCAFGWRLRLRLLARSGEPSMSAPCPLPGAKRTRYAQIEFFRV